MQTVIIRVETQTDIGKNENRPQVHTTTTGRKFRANNRFQQTENLLTDIFVSVKVLQGAKKSEKF